MAVGTRPNQNLKPRCRSRQRNTSTPPDSITKAPSRPKAYMSPSVSMWPCVIKITAKGTPVATRIAKCGVLNAALRTIKRRGKKFRSAKARNT